MKQRTLAQNIEITGVGLHSGHRVQMQLSPLPENSGICFARTDLAGDAARQIRLSPDLINDTRLSSTIVTGDGIRIGTIEHLMSALCAMGIDNILIALDAPEVPIMDGSSLPFIYLLREAGIIDQRAEKRFIRILHEISVEEPGKKVQFVPYDGFKIRLQIDFDHPLFRRSNQDYEIDFARASYLEEISRARTFGFMQEMELMRAHNLGLGGNLDNAVVIDDADILNPDGLRYPDEFVRHKILDAVGDLYVAGYPIIGAFRGSRSGHAINNALLRKLLSDSSFYEWVSFPDDVGLPAAFHPLDEAA